MSLINPISVRVWGDYACFTRPEMKVERVSYPICTPSAARGILEAIFWEPQIYYVIDTITVVKKGRWFNFRRNEVTAVINLKEAQSWMTGKTPVKHISAGGGAPDAAQRNMLGLADVEYIITAEARASKLHDATRFNLQKYLNEIQRRASKGKCYHRPAFGCREFAADFEWVSDVKEVLEQRVAEVGASDNKDWRKTWPEEDLGLMLYDVFDVSQREDGFRWLTDYELKTTLPEGSPSATPRTQKGKKKAVRDDDIKCFEGTSITPHAAFFYARIKDSQMDCHPDRIKIIPKPKRRWSDVTSSFA